MKSLRILTLSLGLLCGCSASLGDRNTKTIDQPFADVVEQIQQTLNVSGFSIDQVQDSEPGFVMISGFIKARVFRASDQIVNVAEYTITAEDQGVQTVVTYSDNNRSRTSGQASSADSASDDQYSRKFWSELDRRLR